MSGGDRVNRDALEERAHAVGALDDQLAAVVLVRTAEEEGRRRRLASDQIQAASFDTAAFQPTMEP
jgi:hypothetical protein